MKGVTKGTAEKQNYDIYLVDASPIMLKGFTELLASQPRFRVCGQATNSKAALVGLQQTEPDLVIVDIALSLSEGIQLIKSLVTLHPKLPILACSICTESSHAEAVLRAGARGCILKQAPTEELIGAIWQLLCGSYYFSPNLELRLLRTWLNGKPASDSPVERLTMRELQVFELIGLGNKTSEIAAKLNLSVKTIETYRAQIKEKINLRNSTQLAGQAARWVSLQS